MTDDAGGDISGSLFRTNILEALFTGRISPERFVFYVQNENERDNITLRDIIEVEYEKDTEIGKMLFDYLPLYEVALAEYESGECNQKPNFDPMSRLGGVFAQRDSIDIQSYRGVIDCLNVVRTAEGKKVLIEAVKGGLLGLVVGRKITPDQAVSYARTWTGREQITLRDIAEEDCRRQPQSTIMQTFLESHLPDYEAAMQAYEREGGQKPELTLPDIRPPGPPPRHPREPQY